MGRENIATNAQLQFADAVYRDIGAVIHPIADGDLHRFDDPEGKRKNGACWYVLYLDGIPGGAFGNWRTGYRSNWRANSLKEMNPVERARLDAVVRIAKEKRDRAKLENQANTARLAGSRWNNAAPATAEHPYLTSKRISALGLRQTGDTLLTPLRDINGKLLNLQTINSNGEKRFLRGGRISGCFALAGARVIPETGDLYIAEGWATAATIVRTLQVPVVAAMYAENLKPVAEAIRQKFPRLAIVVAADNDHNTPGNPGLVKAKEAAKSVEGTMTLPRVCLKFGCRCTDFNDTAYCQELSQ